MRQRGKTWLLLSKQHNQYIFGPEKEKPRVSGVFLIVDQRR
jgi:hypothetical protein